jgi:hypothetical protein
MWQAINPVEQIKTSLVWRGVFHTEENVIAYENALDDIFESVSSERSCMLCRTQKGEN